MTILLGIVSGVLLLIGTGLMLVGSIGIYRLPDVYLRMAAATKASTLGASCMLLAMAIYFLELPIITRAVAVVVFLFLTAPIAAHMIGRAAYSRGDALWEGTVTDELKGYYEQRGRPPRGEQQPGDITLSASSATEHEGAAR